MRAEEAGVGKSMKLVWVMAAALAACGDETGIVEKTIARMEVREGDRPVLMNSTLIVNDAIQTTIRIANTGDGDLVIKGLALESGIAGAFTLVALPTPSQASPVVVAPGGAPYEIAIDFDAARVPEGVRARATVRIETGLTLEGEGTFVFHVMPEAVVAKLVVQPGLIDFETVESGMTATKAMNLLNTGAAPLTITDIRLSGDAGFSATVAGWAVTSAGGGLGAPLVLGPSSARQVDVTFASRGQGAARAELVFVSNDPGAEAGTRVRLFANLAGPCVRPSPTRLDFGAKPVGQPSTLVVELESCGDRDVVISALGLPDDGGGVFTLGPGAPSLPLTIPPGGHASVPVTYAPEAEAALGSDGLYIDDRGRLEIRSNAYDEPVAVPLSGFGSGASCPIAVIEVAEGRKVLPQTLLHLTSRSSSPNGPITAWQWTVLQPDHSVSQFFPSAIVEAPMFTPNIVGTYIFRLEVTDARGDKSCVPAEYIVEVASDDAIHVELVWRTPGDIDETDEGGNATFSWGSDVDLHFLHPLADGQFFHDSYDCYWMTPTLDWGASGPAGDPRLDRDDRDGGGPENLNVKVPEDGAQYRVGVHYYNDWGYGGAFATVRVYIYGVLREQWVEVPISNAALWESHTIDWPTGRVTRIVDAEGKPKITAGYPLP